MSQPPRMIAILLAKSIAEKFSKAGDMGHAMADIITGAHAINEFLEGKIVGVLLEDEEDYDDEAGATH